MLLCPKSVVPSPEDRRLITAACLDAASTHMDQAIRQLEQAAPLAPREDTRRLVLALLDWLRDGCDELSVHWERLT